MRDGKRAILTSAALALALLVLGSARPHAQGSVRGLRLDQLVPPSATVGTDSVIVTLAGKGFRAGDVLLSTSPSVLVLSFTVVSPSIATATLRILPDAYPGPVRLDIWGFGQTTAKQVPPPPPLLLYPPGGLAGPQAIRDAAVVAPIPGTLITAGEPVFARGLLSASGTGTVIGAFLLDGIPFDQFTAVVTGGEPVGVLAKVPIPGTYMGAHDLQIQILYPQRFLSGSVRVIVSPDSRTAFQLIAPADGAVAASLPRFRWTRVPGAAHYEVLWAREDATQTATFSSTGDSWTPNRSQAELLGTGQARWSVRPVFPGNVPGAAAPWRRLLVQGSAVKLSLAPQEPGPMPGSVVLSWGGGSKDILYLLEFTKSGEGGRPLFRALTKRTNYLLRSFPAPDQVDFRITPLSPAGRRLGEPITGRVTRSFSGLNPPGLGPRLAEAPASLQGTTPVDGAVVEDPLVAIGARWTGTAQPGQTTVSLDDTDVTELATLSPERLVYMPVLPLTNGTHTVRITLDGTVFQWGFTVRAASQTPPEEEEPPPAAEGLPDESGTAAETPSRSWAATADGTLTGTSGSPADQGNTFRFTFSSQSDVGKGNWFFRDTVDASFRHDLSTPRSTLNESRNWVIEGGFRGQRWGWSGKVGYLSPDCLGETQLVSQGLARGGAEAILTTPAGKLSAYGSFDDSISGLGSGSGAGEIRMRAAAYSLPLPDNRFEVSLMGLWSDQEATASAKGGSGSVFGILARLDFAPQFRVVLEAARARDRPDGEEALQGDGYRLGISGTVSGTTYGIDLLKVASTFDNPANPGYTERGVPDRTGGDLRLSRAFGDLSTALSLGYVKSDASGGRGGDAESRQTHGALTLTYHATRTVLLSGTLNGSWSRRDADVANRLPGIDQRLRGLSLSAVEQMGKLSFSQTYAGQSSRDDLNPLSRSTTNTFAMTLGGSIAGTFGMAATGAFTRNWSAAVAGRTDLVVASVAPYWSLPGLGLTLTPRLSYTRNLNSSGTLDHHAEQYQLSIAWNPAWWDSFMSLQCSGEYDRNLNALTPVPVVSHHRYTISLVLRWGGGTGELNHCYAQQGNGPPVVPPLPGLRGGSGI